MRQIFIAVLAVIGPVALSGQAAPAIRSDTTTLRSYDGRSLPAFALSLTVPDRRSRPRGQVTVAALRIPTTATQPGRPIVFLMGGPGIPGSVMVPIPPYFTLFQRLRKLGDVIIIDQRGIGRSEPALDCPVSKAFPTDVFVTPAHLVASFREQVFTCANEWRAKGVDPTAFNTIESAADLDDLRRALEIDQVDLLAFSYGTRLALAFVQNYGTHVGRIVLQGVNGPGLVVKRPGPVVRKLERINAILKADTAWHGTVDLRRAASDARARLARSPARLTIRDRSAVEPLDLVVGSDGFDALVALNLDDPRLPALLVSVANNDDSLLARFVEAAWTGLNSGKVGLMARSVNCAADRPSSRWTLARKESARAPFGAPIDNAFLTDDFCRAIGYESPAVEFARPVRSSVPALLITGALDATNPIENAREVARTLPNTQLLEVENAAHEALTIPAVQDVVVDFLNGSDVRARRVSAPVPHFPSLSQALQPAPRRGQ